MKSINCKYSLPVPIELQITVVNDLNFWKNRRWLTDYIILTHLPQVPHMCVNEQGQFWSKPLPEAMLAYCQFYSREQTSANFEWELIQENAFEIVVCQNGGHFVQGLMSFFNQALWRRMEFQFLGVRLSPSQMLIYCKVHHEKHISMKPGSKFKHTHSKMCLKLSCVNCRRYWFNCIMIKSPNPCIVSK